MADANRTHNVQMADREFIKRQSPTGVPHEGRGQP
jgi:hypothetical protein